MAAGLFACGQAAARTVGRSAGPLLAHALDPVTSRWIVLARSPPVARPLASSSPALCVDQSPSGKRSSFFREVVGLCPYWAKMH